MVVDLRVFRNDCRITYQNYKMPVEYVFNSTSQELTGTVYICEEGQSLTSLALPSYVLPLNLDFASVLSLGCRF